jgi:DNA-binding response OmpR family regulator
MHPQMPSVIILSAYDQFSDRAEGMKLGAVDYLVKPFDLSEMTARIREFTERPGLPRKDLASHCIATEFRPLSFQAISLKAG